MLYLWGCLAWGSEIYKFFNVWLRYSATDQIISWLNVWHQLWKMQLRAFTGWQHQISYQPEVWVLSTILLMKKRLTTQKFIKRGSTTTILNRNLTVQVVLEGGVRMCTRTPFYLWVVADFRAQWEFVYFFRYSFLILLITKALSIWT